MNVLIEQSDLSNLSLVDSSFEQSVNLAVVDLFLIPLAWPTSWVAWLSLAVDPDITANEVLLLTAPSSPPSPPTGFQNTWVEFGSSELPVCMLNRFGEVVFPLSFSPGNKAVPSQVTNLKGD